MRANRMLKYLKEIRLLQVHVKVTDGASDRQRLLRSLTMPELVRVFDKDKACQRLWQGQSLSEALVRTELVRVFGKDRACQRPHGKDRAWQSL